MESLVIPHLDYCSVVYLDASLAFRKRLQWLANAGLRYIFGVRWDAHVSPLRSQLGWLRNDSRRDYFISRVMYRMVRMERTSPMVYSTWWTLVHTHLSLLVIPKSLKWTNKFDMHTSLYCFLNLWFSKALNRSQKSIVEFRHFLFYCFLNLWLSKAMNWSQKSIVKFRHFLGLYMICIEKKSLLPKMYVCVSMCVSVCVSVCKCPFFVAR